MPALMYNRGVPVVRTAAAATSAAGDALRPSENVFELRSTPPLQHIDAGFHDDRSPPTPSFKAY